MTFNVYRKEKNDLNPPAEIATGLTNKEFEDTTLSKDTAYLVSVSAEKNGIEKFSDELLVYLASEHEDSGYLIPQIRVPKIDWSSSSTDYQAVITADASWQSTDYCIFTFHSKSETITPPVGISLIFTQQAINMSNSYMHVFGGLKSSASSFTFNLSTATGGSCFGVLGYAISNIDSVDDIVYSESNGVNFNSAVLNKNTDGLFCVVAHNFDTVVTRTYAPTAPITANTAYSEVSGVRYAAMSANHVADNLSIAKSRQFITSPTTNNAQAAIFFKRKAGVKPAITYNKTPLNNQISTSKGYAYAFLKDGEIVEIVTGGVEKTGGNAITENTVFQLASVSKLITELVVRMLVQEGLLTLDDTIGQHLAGYSLGLNVANITIRDLLDMKSGISWAYNLQNTDWEQETRTWLSKNSSGAGFRYIYDNGCMSALELIINSVIGDYVTYTQDNLFKKLGIYDATNDSTSLSIKAYSSSLTEGNLLDIRATAAAGWCMSLKSLAKIAKTLRYSMLLDNQDEMIGDRYRMIPVDSLRGEMFHHDGGLVDSNSRGIRSQYVMGCDGYDVIALTNTYLASAMLNSCKDSLSV